MIYKSITFFKLLFFLFFFLLSAYLGYAANHCVRSDATGSGTGNDWDNAYTSLPANLVRGDTYYIADGTYGDYIFDDPEVSNLYIIIIKATISEHGIGSGWNNSYGDGQAHFNSETINEFYSIISFQKGYYIFDGVTGTGGMENVATYGFKITPVNPNRNNYLLGIPAIGDITKKIRYVEIRHTAIINVGYSYGNGVNTQIGIYSNSDVNYEPENILIANNLFANSSSNLLIRKWKNCIIDNNWFDSNWSSSNNHGQQISPGDECDDIILKNNIFKNSTIFVVGCHESNNKRWKIFNNIIIGGSVTSIWAAAESGKTDLIINWEVCNNTHVNVAIGGRGAFYAGTLSDVSSSRSYAYNNLFYNCSSPVLDNADGTISAITHNYNAFFRCTGRITSETNTQISNMDPFIDLNNADYHLNQATMSGKNDLGSPYNIDRDGLVRGNDGSWDMGVYEYNSHFQPRKIRPVIPAVP